MFSVGSQDVNDFGTESIVQQIYDFLDEVCEWYQCNSVVLRIMYGFWLNDTGLELLLTQNLSI